MSRQLLPRQRTELPARGRNGTPTPAAPAPAAPAGSARLLRRPAVLALVACAAAVLAGLAWTLVRTPGEATAENASALVRPAATTAATPTPTPTPTRRSAEVPSGAPSARDPFGGEPAPGGPSTRPPADTVASGTAAPATAPTATPAASPAPGVVTTTVTARPAATPTVTMTAPGSAVYVGLYLWNGDRASFRVNARTYSKPVGSTFGPQLTFARIVEGTPRCARLTYQGKAFTLCPGQVVELP